MSSKCYQCFRPLSSCYCQHINMIDPKIKFLFLMHPHEAYKEKTGTGRLASLSLENSEILVGISFDKNERIRELLEDDNYFPIILYPGEDVLYSDSCEIQRTKSKKKLLVLLIDATWVMARKMMHRSLILQKLPRISFNKEYISKFEIKKQPMSYCLSTIESVYYLLREFQNSGVVSSRVQTNGLMEIFERMINFQQFRKGQRIKNHPPIESNKRMI